MTLDKLMRRLIDGDSSVFEQIYEQTRKSVYYTALSVLRDKQLAEDVMQTTYLRVLKSAKSYQAGTNAAAWIARIARNEALNTAKSRAREQSVDTTENAAIFGSSHQDDYGLLIDAARRTLPEDEFTILMLVTTGGFKRREIGEMLDMPIPTVTWKYNNAIARLRKTMKQ